jgi:hypothetical protein
MIQLKSFNVLQTAKVLGAVYFAVGSAFLPFILLRILTAHKGPTLANLAIALVSPFIYGAAGFVFSAVFCWLYNIIASHVGGIEFDFAEPL